MSSIAKISDLLPQDQRAENAPEKADAPAPGTPPAAESAAPAAGRRLYLWIAAGLLVITMLVGWQIARRYFLWDNFGVVEPGLIYRAGQLSPAQLEYLITHYGIKTVIRANIPELSLKDMAREQIVCNRHNVRVMPLIMPGDGRGEFTQYDQAVEILKDARNLPALITCARGAYRTGAIVACYRVLVQSWPPSRAFDEMQQFRFDPMWRPGAGEDKEHPLLAHLRAYFKERTGYEK